MAGAGILISLGKEGNLDELLASGYYSTDMSESWSNPTEGTLGDYLLVSPGDNVYFFQDRTVYGIGTVVDVLGGGDGSFAVNGSVTSVNYPEKKLSTKDNPVKVQRWGFAFKADPFFFASGLDMDDLLNSDPAAFRILRAFWKRSFIRFDMNENRAFKSALIRLNRTYLDVSSASEHRPSFDWSEARGIEYAAGSKTWTRIDLTRLLMEKRKKNGHSSSEMVVECALLNELNSGSEDAVSCFGKWDYLAHQVVASPFKPIDYMDRIDVFGYRWVNGYEGEAISKFLVVEIKKDSSQNDADGKTRDYEQLMKYVDWVCANYAHGDYSMIEAYLVATDFKFGPKKRAAMSCERMRKAVNRTYTVGHNAETRQWNSVSLVSYSLSEDGRIGFAKEDLPA